MSDGRHSTEIEMGMLQMQVLWLLDKQATHGYELMKRLNAIKRTKVTQGTLYPVLQKLVLLKLIKSSEKDRKKIYSLTAKGEKTMKHACEDFVKIYEGIVRDFVCRGCSTEDHNKYAQRQFIELH
jgi:PadR family transcriptional regulator, regulatory protein PadR